MCIIHLLCFFWFLHFLKNKGYYAKEISFMDTSRLLDILEQLYVDREPKSIKSDYGKTLLIGGSRLYPHAVTIAAQFAEISGVAFVSFAVPNTIYSIVGVRCSLTDIFEDLANRDDCFLLEETKEHLDHILTTYSSILIGNGMKCCFENYQFLSYLIEHYSGNLIIDATGIRLLSDFGIQALEKKNKNSKILLTPHLGEAKKLLNSSLSTRDPMYYVPDAVTFCKRYSVSLLLKSFSSVLITEEGNIFSSQYEPTPTLAKAGSGDGLSGYLAGILAYGRKYLPYTDLILFGDLLIHNAAKMAGDKYSSGYTSILSCKEEIQLMIQEVMKTHRR